MSKDTLIDLLVLLILLPTSRGSIGSRAQEYVSGKSDPLAVCRPKPAKKKSRPSRLNGPDGLPGDGGGSIGHVVQGPTMLNTFKMNDLRARAGTALSACFPVIGECWTPAKRNALI